MKKDGRATYSAKSFDHLRGLTGISDAQITEHLDLYVGYVKQVNSLVQELSEMRADRKEAGKRFQPRRRNSSARVRVRRHGPARALLLQPEAGGRSPAHGSAGARARARRDPRISRAVAGEISH